MNVYRLRPMHTARGQSVYSSWQTVPSTVDVAVLGEFEKNRLGGPKRFEAKGWEPIRVKRNADDGAKADGNFGDLNNGYFAADVVAKDCLADVGTGDVAWLTLQADEKALYWVMPLRCIDALDRSRSEWKSRSYAPDAVFEITKHAFIERELETTQVFVMPDGLGHTFCRDEFKKQYEKCGLTGLTFDLITRRP